MHRIGLAQQAWPTTHAQAAGVNHCVKPGTVLKVSLSEFSVCQTAGTVRLS